MWRVDSLHLYICYSIHIIVVITLLQRDVSTTLLQRVGWFLPVRLRYGLAQFHQSHQVVLVRGLGEWLVKCLSVCLWVLCVCAFLLCMGRTPPAQVSFETERLLGRGWHGAWNILYIYIYSNIQIESINTDMYIYIYVYHRHLCLL